jgi:TonB family protein
MKVSEVEKKTRVTYLKIKPEKKDAVKFPRNDPLKRIPPPFIEPAKISKEDNLAPKRDTFTKPALIKPDVIAIKKKITLPPVDMQKIDNPSYISYYQIVREKIRRSAYQNYSRSDTGEVYITFVVLSDGTLKNARLVEDRSSVNSYLRSIALSSVKGADPFPDFPKELDYPELSFNVVISFEIE